MRLSLFVASILCSLTLAGAAAAYPWPVKPFDTAHPVRANFGDPRTVFQMTLFQDGMTGPGEFSFHNGIDISAPDGTEVFPVVSGTVTSVAGKTVTVRTNQSRTFQYVHVTPVAFVGQQVVARKTLLGYVAPTYGHVHLDELHGSRIWNPLARGGIAPYVDRTNPHVASVMFRVPGSLTPLDPLGICGTISIAAEAFDTPQVKVPGNFAGFPVSPALLSWSVRRVRGAVVQQTTAAADFRTTLPSVSDFWSVYARGTYQNAPRFGNRQFTLMPGRFIYNLNESFDTRTVPNGVYQVGVKAEDMRGNSGVLNQRLTIVNQPRTETGCPPAPATPPPPPPPTVAPPATPPPPG